MAGARVALELIEHPQARMVRQAHVQHDGVRIEFLRKRERLGRASGDKAFELHLAGKIPEDSSETLIVFDDQEHAPLASQPFTIVLDPAGPADGCSWAPGTGSRRLKRKSGGGSRWPARPAAAHSLR